MVSFDFEKFRLRSFVERLIEMGEVEVHEQPVALTDLSDHCEAATKASLFRRAGPARGGRTDAARQRRVRIAGTDTGAANAHLRRARLRHHEFARTGPRGGEVRMLPGTEAPVIVSGG